MSTDTLPDRLERARRGVGVAGQGPGTPRSRSTTPLGRAGLTLVLFALPSLILLVLLNLFPVIYAFVQSFQNGTPSTVPTEAPFVGLANYTTVLTSPEFWGAVGFAVAFTIVVMNVSAVAGVGAALLGRKVWR